jgi:hypothetical protein
MYNQRLKTSGLLHSSYLNCIVINENILACARESTRSISSLPHTKQARQMVVSELYHGERLTALPNACIDPRPSSYTKIWTWSCSLSSAHAKRSVLRERKPSWTHIQPACAWTRRRPGGSRGQFCHDVGFCASPERLPHPCQPKFPDILRGLRDDR